MTTSLTEFQDYVNMIVVNNNVTTAEVIVPYLMHIYENLAKSYHFGRLNEFGVFEYLDRVGLPTEQNPSV